MDTPESAVWYIVKQPSGVCEIVVAERGATPSPDDTSAHPEEAHRWGPFVSRSEAIARRVGLIRAGKCQPV